MSKETPKQRILRCRRQIDSINDTYELFIGPPCLCEFCAKFWVTKYYEGDNDWGCNAGVENEDVGLGLIKCRYFTKFARWEVMVEKRVSDALYEAIRGLAPYSKSVKDLQKEAKVLEKLIEQKKQEAAHYAAIHDMLEVLARMQGKS